MPSGQRSISALTHSYASIFHAHLVAAASRWRSKATPLSRTLMAAVRPRTPARPERAISVSRGKSTSPPGRSASPGRRRLLLLFLSQLSNRVYLSAGPGGVEKAWLGITHALDHAHHLSILVAGAITIDGSVGDLHFPVVAHDNSGFITAQFVLSHQSRSLAPSIYLRAGVGAYTSKEEYC